MGRNYVSLLKNKEGKEKEKAEGLSEKFEVLFSLVVAEEGRADAIVSSKNRTTNESTYTTRVAASPRTEVSEAVGAAASPPIGREPTTETQPSGGDSHLDQACPS